jgi:ABC-type dipeptide/oligopeptide/nickel transport system permease component
MQNMHLSATSFNQVCLLDAQCLRVALLTTSQFFPTVVSSLGFNTTITLVLTAPPSLVAGVVGICVGISSGKFNDRTWHITVMMGIAVVGFVISAVTLNVPARYLSCFLFASGTFKPKSPTLRHHMLT